MLSAAANTRRLLTLGHGAVKISQGSVQVGIVHEPVAATSELALLLDQTDTADARAIEPMRFRTGDGGALLTGDPEVALLVATGLARRIDPVKRSLIEIRADVVQDEPSRGRVQDLGKIARPLRLDQSDGLMPRHSINLESPLAATRRLRRGCYASGQTVWAQDSTTDKVWILQEGAVEIVSEGQRLARASVGRALLGEISSLLNQPHRKCRSSARWHLAAGDASSTPMDTDTEVRPHRRLPPGLQ